MGRFFDYLLELFVRMPWWGQLAVVALLLAVALLASLRFVKEGERGLVLRLGQVVRRDGRPRVIEPGFLFLIPKVDSLVRRHVRQQTIELNEQEVILKDNTIWVVSAVVFFRVKDIYKALFEIDDLDGGVRNLCMGELRRPTGDAGANAHRPEVMRSSQTVALTEKEIRNAEIARRVFGPRSS